MSTYVARGFGVFWEGRDCFSKCALQTFLHHSIWKLSWQRCFTIAFRKTNFAVASIRELFDFLLSQKPLSPKTLSVDFLVIHITRIWYKYAVVGLAAFASLGNVRFTTIFSMCGCGVVLAWNGAIEFCVVATSLRPYMRFGCYFMARISFRLRHANFFTHTWKAGRLFSGNQYTYMVIFPWPSPHTCCQAFHGTRHYHHRVFFFL